MNTTVSNSLKDKISKITPQSKFFMTINQIDVHSYFSLGVIIDGQPVILGNFGKYGNLTQLDLTTTSKQEYYKNALLNRFYEAKFYTDFISNTKQDAFLTTEKTFSDKNQTRKSIT